jgi:hypothetical protein
MYVKYTMRIAVIKKLRIASLGTNDTNFWTYVLLLRGENNIILTKCINVCTNYYEY